MKAIRPDLNICQNLNLSRNLNIKQKLKRSNHQQKSAIANLPVGHPIPVLLS